MEFEDYDEAKRCKEMIQRLRSVTRREPWTGRTASGRLYCVLPPQSEATPRRALTQLEEKTWLTVASEDYGSALNALNTTQGVLEETSAPL